MTAQLKTVDIVEFDFESKSNLLLARLVLDDAGGIDVIELTDNGAFVARELVLKHPIPADGRWLTVSDGEAYLAALSDHVKGPFLFAKPMRLMPAFELHPKTPPPMR